MLPNTALYREDVADGKEEVSNEIIKLKDPHTLNRLWTRVLDPDLGVTLETHRYYFRAYPGTFQGNKLVDWLMKQDSSTSSSQALAIGTPGLFQ